VVVAAKQMDGRECVHSFPDLALSVKHFSSSHEMKYKWKRQSFYRLYINHF
jgi:hypothetical protein